VIQCVDYFRGNNVSLDTSSDHDIAVERVKDAVSHDETISIDRLLPYLMIKDESFRQYALEEYDKWADVELSMNDINTIAKMALLTMRSSQGNPRIHATVLKNILGLKRELRILKSEIDDLKKVQPSPAVASILPSFARSRRSFAKSPRRKLKVLGGKKYTRKNKST